MAFVEPLALWINTPGWGRRGRGARGPGNRERGDRPDAAARAEDDARTKDLLGWFERAREYQRVRDEATRRGVPQPPHDVRLAALSPYAQGERPVVFDADDEKAIVKALELAARLRVRPIIGGGREAWKVAGLLAQHDVPVLLGPVLANPTDSWDPYDAAYANAGVLQRAGVRFAFQSGDSANSRNLPYHAAMAAAFGLPRDAALAAVTLRAAQIFGIDHEIGSIETGKLADLVLTDGDLLDIRTQVKGVFIRGRAVPLESRHTRLYDTYAKRLAGEE
jgi:imidazolonepropionase-like amidohydrolase